VFGEARAIRLSGERLVDSGYYAAFTGLIARMDALDVVANNLANVSTTGFRGQHEFYEAVTANAGAPYLSPLNAAINNYGVLGGANMDLQQGNLQPTGNSLDLGIRGAAFFAVQTARGVRYTRNGSFHVSATGQIVTQDGDPVLGPGGPIQVPQGSIDVAADGTVSVASAVSGQIRLASFDPGTDLRPEGNTNFIAPAGAEKPATDSTMSSGMLEASNLSALKETVTLMVLQRQTELLEKTLSIFLDDFNRTAV
jgi:flagellar basal-body rod protein FlgF